MLAPPDSCKQDIGRDHVPHRVVLAFNSMKSTSRMKTVGMIASFCIILMPLSGGDINLTVSVY